MGVERAGTGRLQFLGGQQFLQPLALFSPFLVQGIKDLGQSAPADISDERSLFFARGGSRLCFETFEKFNGSEIVPALLLERTDAHSVGVSDAIIVLIADWFGIPNRRQAGRFSGVRRMYLSLTISHAVR